MVLAVQEKNKMAYDIPEKLCDAVFRTYDIRGEASDDKISPDLAYALGRAYGSRVIGVGETDVIVGRDARLTGHALQEALMTGLCESGCNVIDIGVVSTPMLYFATCHLPAQSGIMVTASHNPVGDNGFKCVLSGNSLRTDEIQSIKDQILRRDFITGQGQLSKADVLADYVACIVSKIHLDRPLKVVIDCGNGVGGVAAPMIFKQLGCEVIELYCDLDGSFPNHHPDPTVLENVRDVMNAVKTHEADIGLAFDGDADRVGVITDQGEIVWPDRQMLLFSRDILAKIPGSEIIFDVKCTNHLDTMITQWGGTPIMYRTGHSLMKAKLKERAAPLAGEMSGHIFFNDDWFGFDDGVYVGARLLQIIAAQPDPASSVFAALPDSVNTPELKLPVVEENKQLLMDKLLSQGQFDEARLITIDGLRVDFGYGWGLVRASNTSAYLILRFEAESQEYLRSIQEIFREQLLLIDPDLQLPF